jgi:hypothetical protein
MPTLMTMAKALTAEEESTVVVDTALYRSGRCTIDYCSPGACHHFRAAWEEEKVVACHSVVEAMVAGGGQGRRHTRAI